MSGFCYFLAEALRRKGLDDNRGSQTAKVLMSVFMVSFAAMWVSTSVAGSSMKLSETVWAFGGALMFGTLGIIGTTVGWHALSAHVKNIPLVQKMGKGASGNWAKGFAALCLAPMYVAFTGVSFLNQRIRLLMRKSAFLRENVASDDKSQRKWGDFTCPDEKTLWVTIACHRQLQAFKKWKWTHILMHAHYWGIIYYTLNVGITRIVSVFLSWLNTKLAAESFGTSLAIFYAVGLTMFLLPPVPGVPVYVTGGIILVNAAWKTFTPACTTLQETWNVEGHPMNGEIVQAGECGDDAGYWKAVGFTIAICFSLKLNAIAIQQKIIGELMGNSVKVRKLVSVNSNTIKAIRVILSAPGISLGKVAILCGGPDWPTSVLTGILKLSLVKMLIGSLPVIFLVSPCVMGGAFLLRNGPKDPPYWKALATATLSVAALTQTGAMMAALHYIVRAQETRKDEIAQIEDDLEVKKADELAVEKKRRYDEKIDWFNSVPLPIKAVLVLGTLSSSAFVLLFFMFSSKCFYRFDVVQNIDNPLPDQECTTLAACDKWRNGRNMTCADGLCKSDTEEYGLSGNVLNMVKDYGIYGHVVFGFAMVCLFVVFKIWVKTCAKARDRVAPAS